MGMKNNPTSQAFALAAAALFLSPSAIPHATTDKDPETYVLRVGLFPYVPAPEDLEAWIEADFKQKTGHIVDVVLDEEQFNPYPKKPAYDITQLSVPLVSKKDKPRTFDMIEVDAIFLSELEDTGAIAPFSSKRTDWHPAAVEAVTVDGKVYGVPHWMCGYFIVSADAKVLAARNVVELDQALSSSSAGKQDLTGDISGTYDTLFFYLDALRDQDPAADLAGALDDVDENILTALGRVTERCMVSGENLCDDEAWPPARPGEFAAGSADAFLGYSERLHSILSAKPKASLSIAAAPLGGGRNATLFTDALVLSKECVGPCKLVADSFAAYLVSDETFASLLMAKDVRGGAVPRYLLPSTAGAFKTKDVQADTFYMQLQDAVSNARSFPNEGVPAHVRAGQVRGEIERHLFGPPAPTTPN